MSKIFEWEVAFKALGGIPARSDIFFCLKTKENIIPLGKFENGIYSKKNRSIEL